jgi:hypothetical protein
MPTSNLAYVDCFDCERHGTQAVTVEAAEQLAGLHDDLHHRGVPTAEVRSAGREATTSRQAAQ